MQIYDEKLEFSEKVGSKVGSMEKVTHKPGGGDKKVMVLHIRSGQTVQTQFSLLLKASGGTFFAIPSASFRQMSPNLRIMTAIFHMSKLLELMVAIMDEGEKQQHSLNMCISSITVACLGISVMPLALPAIHAM